jgi:hypothetical protein
MGDNAPSTLGFTLVYMPASTRIASCRAGGLGMLPEDHDHQAYQHLCAENDGGPITVTF